MPPADTTNPRDRSCSLSTPTVAPARTTTFLSRMAFRTTARRPIRVLCRITDRSTRAQLSTWTPVHVIGPGHEHQAGPVTFDEGQRLVDRVRRAGLPARAEP